MKLLEKFKSNLQSAKMEDDDEEEEEKEEKEKKEEEDEDEDLSGRNWMKKSLKFESDAPVLAKDASTKDDDWFDIYDPRNPVNKRRRLEDAKKSRRK